MPDRPSLNIEIFDTNTLLNNHTSTAGAAFLFTLKKNFSLAQTETINNRTTITPPKNTKANK